MKASISLGRSTRARAAVEDGLGSTRRRLDLRFQDVFMALLDQALLQEVAVHLL